MKEGLSFALRAKHQKEMCTRNQHEQTSCHPSILYWFLALIQSNVQSYTLYIIEFSKTLYKNPVTFVTWKSSCDHFFVSGPYLQYILVFLDGSLLDGSLLDGSLGGVLAKHVLFLERQFHVACTIAGLLCSSNDW